LLLRLPTLSVGDLKLPQYLALVGVQGGRAAGVQEQNILAGFESKLDARAIQRLAMAVQVVSICKIGDDRKSPLLT
jgi:hypothetical protein